MVSGVIAEFNIFHNGHKYLVDEAKKQSDAVVSVMSGSFVQRGDTAIADKWSRARAALMCGVDLVLELPVCYALNAAPDFAAGGVNTLASLGIIDTLVFGSESGDIDVLSEAAHKADGDNETVKRLMADGLSYPAALGRACGDIFQGSNNILAVEYIRAINNYGADMKPVTIKRQGVAHDDDNTSGKFASASKIREMIFNNEDISQYIPYPLSEIGSQPYLLSRLDSAFAAKLRTMSADELALISEVSEGLENRILSAARECDTFTGIAEAVKSKRYTMSKIRRILIAALLGFDKDIYSPEPEYIRILGMNRRGAEILKKAKKNCSVPVITKAADYRETSKMFELDLRATDIAALCSPDVNMRKGGLDFKSSPVIWEV